MDRAQLHGHGDGHKVRLLRLSERPRRPTAEAFRERRAEHDDDALPTVLIAGQQLVRALPRPLVGLANAAFGAASSLAAHVLLLRVCRVISAHTATVSVALKAGANTIKLTAAGTSGPNIYSMMLA